MKPKLTVAQTKTARVALQEAVAIRKSQKAFANAIHVSQGTISLWLLRGYIAAEHVIAAEYATGVSRHRLRPDVYPDGDGSR